MSIFKGIKGKVAGTIMVGALVTGAGAAAASQFSDHIKDAASTLGDKAAQTVAYFVDNHAEKREDQIETKVQDSFTKAAKDAYNYSVQEYGRGVGEINIYADTYTANIDNAVDYQLKQGKSKITKAVNEEIAEGKEQINEAAKAKADALFSQVESLYSKIPAQPQE